MDKRKLKPLPQNKIGRAGYLLAQRYLRHNVGIQSAALAFYILFTLFPLMIFVNSLVGILHIDSIGILAELSEVLPQEVIDFMQMYLEYVQETSSMKMLWFGLFFSIYFPMRATNTLMRAVRTAYHLGPPIRAIAHQLRTLLYTVILIVTIILSLTLLTVSEYALDYATLHLGLPQIVARLWTLLRFPTIGVLMFFAIALLYAMTQDVRQPRRNIYPGVFGALIAWLVLSALYSFYVENFANYSVIYGSIGTMMVLLVWLYLSAAALIMGAELNATLISVRKEANTEEKPE